MSTSKDELIAFAQKVGYPVVAKVVGPVHKSDVGGVALNIRTAEHLALEYDRMMQIEGATAVMVQKMLKGTELFIGAKYEERFGHVILCGLGGIFVEVLKDVSSGLAPLSYGEAYSMIHSLRGYKILKGTRGQKGINEQKYAEIIVRLSTLLRFATEIKEMDLNPLLADENGVVAVDARVDPNTLESKHLPRVFFAGEVLDIDGVTGGFNFQAAWTTAYVVAQAIVRHKD